MAKSADKRHVGAWSSTKVELLQSEEAVKQGFASRKVRWWNWPSGPIVLTNLRLIWTPDRVMGFPAKPCIIRLPDIQAVTPYEAKAAEWLLGEKFAWRVRTDDNEYIFGAVGRGTNATAEEWIPILRQWSTKS